MIVYTSPHPASLPYINHNTHTRRPRHQYRQVPLRRPLPPPLPPPPLPEGRSTSGECAILPASFAASNAAAAAAAAWVETPPRRSPPPHPGARGLLRCHYHHRCPVRYSPQPCSPPHPHPHSWHRYHSTTTALLVPCHLPQLDAPLQYSLPTPSRSAAPATFGTCAERVRASEKDR